MTFENAKRNLAAELWLPWEFTWLEESSQHVSQFQNYLASQLEGVQRLLAMKIEKNKLGGQFKGLEHQLGEVRRQLKG